MAFKGESKESVVLCTETKTYDVKEAETSNSILLLPDLTFPDKESNESELISRQVVYFIKKINDILFINMYGCRSLVFFIHIMKSNSVNHV